MLKKVLLTEKQALDKLVKGVDTAVDAVQLTLGPSGKSVIFNKVNELGYEISDDGYYLLKEMELWDEIESLGMKQVRNAAKITDKTVGDGTTTTAVLMRALVHTCLDRMATNGLVGSDGASYADIEAEVTRDIARVVDELSAMAVPVKTREDVLRVATVASGSARLGELIADAYEDVGRTGIVLPEEGISFDIEKEVVKGIEIPYGYFTPYMVNTMKNEAIFEAQERGVSVLVTNHKIEDFSQIKGILEATLRDGATVDASGKMVNPGRKEIVIIAREFAPNILPFINAHWVNASAMKILLIRYVTSDEMMEDVALFCGGEMIDMHKDMPLERTSLEQLGRARKIVASRDRTYILGGFGDQQDINERIERLKNDLTGEKIEKIKERITKRIGQLSGGVVILKIGAPSDGEKTFLRRKIDDAIGSVSSAIQEGIVPGAGMALKAAVAVLSDDSLVKQALQEPYNQVQKNAGNKLVITDEVFDAVKVIKVALQSAASGALALIRIGVATADMREEHCCQKHDIETANLKAKKMQEDIAHAMK